MSAAPSSTRSVESFRVFPAHMATHEKWIFSIIMLAAIVGMVWLFTWTAQEDQDRQQWLDDTLADQQSLNDTYVEDIQVRRELINGGRSTIRVETVVVDGILRDDCAVTDTPVPHLTCATSLTLDSGSPEPRRADLP